MDAANTVINRGALADSAGMIASIVCAIHCAAMPLMVGYLPLLGLDWLAGESFHRVMAIICFALAGSAFFPGWKKHGSLIPVTVGITGVMLLSVAAFGLEGGCCPSCEVAGSGLTEQLACGDDSCPLCLHEAQAITDFEVTAAEPGGWFIPLMTPLGGVLLVIGHVVNHSKSCRCRSDGCCLTVGQTEKLT